MSLLPQSAEASFAAEESSRIHDLTGDKPKTPQKIQYTYIPGAGGL